MADNVVIVDHCSKMYRRTSAEPKKALNDVSVVIERNTVTALLGPNGAGKTTLVKCICGLLTPTSGRIAVFGRNPATNPHPLAGAVLEGSRNIYWNLTIAENLSYFGSLAGCSRHQVKQRTAALLESLDILHKADDVAASLSRGMQQKVAIAVALIADPPLLVLDEPTLGLDVAASHALRDEVKTMWRNKQTTVILSTHDMRVAEELSSRVVILRNGSIVADATPCQLKRQDGMTYTIACRHMRNEWVVRLSERYEVTRSGELTMITVTSKTEHTIAGLVELLTGSADAEIVYVQQDEPDLEQVVLRIITGAPHPDAEATEVAR